LSLVKVAIASTSEVVNVMLNVKIGRWEQSTTLGKLGKGESNFNINVPDISTPTAAEFLLKTSGKILKCQRHWEIFMVPILHHDLVIIM